MSIYKVNSIPVGLPVGMILYYAGSTTTHLPSDWVVCDGRTLSSATYPELYARIGHAYGGDSTNFKVPDLDGTRLRGTGNFSSTHTAGKGGANTVTLSGNHLPSHNHNAVNWYHTHSSNDAQRFHDANGSGNLRYVTTGNSGISDSNYHMRWRSAGAGTGNTSNKGSGAAFSLNPSYIKLYAIIKVS